MEVRVKITLACQDCKQRNYNMTKDKKTHPDRMETKKYCRFCKKHTVHKETTALKKSWTQELKGEFKKITWLDRTTLFKQSAVVIVSTVILGAIIAVVDWLIQIGLNFII